MSASSPLSYLSLKPVLEHMDANFRYCLVSRLPVLRSTHHTTSVKIRNLELGEFAIYVNGVSHSFTTMVVSGHGVREVCSDTDKNGNPDTQLALAESDIALKNKSAIRRYKNFNGPKKPETYSQFRLRLSPTQKIKHSYNFSNRDLTLRNLVRMHLQNICGSCPSVHELSIEDGSAVLRIPNELKFRIRNLVYNSCSNSEIMDLMQPVMSFSSFPLEKLCLILNIPLADILQNPVVQNSQSLELTEACTVESRQVVSAETITNLNGKFIDLQFNGDIAVDVIVEVAQHWIENPKEVGSKISCIPPPFQVRAKLGELETRLDMVRGRLLDIGNCLVRCIDEFRVLVLYADDYRLREQTQIVMEIKGIEEITWL